MITCASPIDIESVCQILSEIAIFGGISDQQLRHILTYLEEGLFQPGEYIFKKGDDPSHIYIVKKGKIDLLITDQEVILKKKILVAGDCFGEASLMAMHKHTATAVALEESTVMILSRPALLRVRKEDTELFSLLMMNIARELARRLELTDEILLHYIKTRKNRVKNPQIP
jgi:CRP/FNR family transcriptional regulator, cyclic AMP receptor protein